jgi:multidrug efflux pump subunit AcrB
VTSVELGPSGKPLTILAVAAARYWKVTIGLWILLLAAGGYAYLSGLDREGFPPINTPIVFVQGPYFADDPEAVDADVSKPLTEAILAVDGVEGVEAFAGRNFASLIVEFNSSFSSAEGVAAIEGIHEGVVPDQVEITYTELDAAGFLNEFDLLVSVVNVGGGDDQDLEAEAIAVAAHLEASADIAVADPQSQFTDAFDIATGEAELRQTSFTRVFLEGDDGFGSAIHIGVDRSGTGLDTLELSDTVAGLLETAPVSDGFEPRITADFAKDIRLQLSNLQSNLLTGLIAVAVVSLLLIGWRTSVITAAFMVTVMAATLLALMFLGQSLNTITLFALILTLGLLVDDAVVIAEAIDANRDTAVEPADVVRVAIDRVGTASLAGTLTTVLVFAPMLFVTGILGEFIRIMPVTVIVALLMSFFLSITLISALAAGFLLKGQGSSSPVVRAQTSVASALGRMIRLVETNRVGGIAVGVVSVVFSLGVIFAAVIVAGGLTFNIFPPSKDSNNIFVAADFDPGTELPEAQVLADQVDAAMLDVLRDDLVSAAYVFSGPGGVNVFVDLTNFNDREPTAKEFAAQIEEQLQGIDGMRPSVSQVDNGPPSEEFPFAVQIRADNDPAAANELAFTLATELEGADVERANGDLARIIEATVSTDGQVARSDGERIIEVRARFDAEDVTALLDATENKVLELHPESDLASRGLVTDALKFDFGQESENQEGFASAGVALQFALLGMLGLLVVLFRSIVQPILIMLAIPFGLFGVFTALRLSDNPISFFVVIGLIGLIGVVVNNTILLTDAANRAWREGAGNAESIAIAVQTRFRPLVATTATTVVGLAPLALSDPFWEALSFTIMFGLIASTILVLVSFPFYYLALVPPSRWLFAKVKGLFGRGSAPAV